MKIFLNIEADDAETFKDVIGSLGAAISAGRYTRTMPGQVEVADSASPVEPETPAAVEEPAAKRTRGPNKPKPTDQAVPDTDASVGGPVASSSTAEATEPLAITHEEVRNQIIDLLNDWSAAAKDNPAVRTEVLAPLLKSLDAEKIGGITPDKYALVPALIDESRAALKAYVEARSVEE